MYSRVIQVAAMLCCAACCMPAAAQQDEEPHVVVTALGGGGATHGPDGRPFPAGEWNYYQDDYALRPGAEPVLTAADGTAVLTMPGYETTLLLGNKQGPSELEISQWAARGRELPLAATLLRGEALVVRKPDDRRWLVIAVRYGGVEGYVRARGATFVVRADDDGVFFAVAQGEVLFFPGSPTDRADDREVRTGEFIPPGQRLLASKRPSTLTADAESVPRALSRLGDTVHNFALAKGTQWIERAEQGDLIPARRAVRGVARVFAEEVGVGRATFDQPRSPVVVTAPAANLAPMNVGLRPAPVTQNLALSLAQSTVPTEAVVGQRLLRTRIIGNPGTSGGILANPRVEQLVRLPGN